METDPADEYRELRREVGDTTDDWYDQPLETDDELYGDVAVEDYLDDDAAALFEDTFYDVEGLDDGTYLAADEDAEVAISYEVETDDDVEYPQITVKVHDMPDGLFGFTETGQTTDQKDVHINSNLYETDQDTVNHEIAHQLNPGKDELQIRYINGDLDPENTASLAHRRHDSPRASMAYDPGIEAADADQYV